MTISIDQIGVGVDTSGVVKGERALDNFGQAANKASRNADKLTDSNSKASKSSTGMASATGALSTQLTGLAAAYVALNSLRALAGAIDNYTRYTAQLKLATRSQQEYNAALQSVNRIANTAQADISAIGTLYARLNNALKDVGVSQKKVSDITETVGLALKVSGATASETSSAMLQLSQAFGSGVLRGEEFNAVNEAAPALMRALAESIGVPIGQLRSMASEGRLTSDVLVKAFGDQALLDKFRAQAKEVQTISGSLQVLKNNLVTFIGLVAEKTGVVDIFSTAIRAGNGALSEFNDYLKTGKLRLEAFLPAYAEFRKKMDDEEAKRIASNKKQNILPQGSIMGSATIIPKNLKLTDQFISTNKEYTQQLEKEANAYSNLTESIKLNSVEIEKQNKIKADALTLLNSNDFAKKISQSDYDAIVKNANAKIASITGETEARKEAEQVRKALNADLLKDIQDQINFEEDLKEAQNKTDIDNVKKLQKAEEEAYKAKLKQLDDLQDVANKNYKEAQETFKRAEDVRLKEFEKTVDGLNQVFREGFANMVNGGKGTWKSFTKSLVTTFKTTVADQIYKMFAQPFIVKLIASIMGIGATGAVSAATSSLGGGRSGSIFGTLTDSISALNTNVVGSIEKLGAFLSTGEGGLGDAIGGFMGQYSSQIAAGLAFAPAALSLLKGDVKSAAFQGAGAGIGLAIGGPVGGAIGAVLGGAVGGLFGSKKSTPRYSAGVSTTYENGVFNSTNLSNIAGFKKDAGGREGMTGAAEIFSKSLGSLLGAFGINSVISTNMEFFRRKGAWGAGSATVDGVQAAGTGRIYNRNQQAAYDEFINAFLTVGLVNAIKVSKIPDGLKALFDGIADRAQLGNMVQAVIGLGSAQDQLTKHYALTASQAGQVSTATGLVGDDLIAFVNKLSGVALSTRTVGEVLVKASQDLEAATGFSALPASVKDFDDLLKGIDKTTQAGVDSFAKLFMLRDNFAQFTASIDALKAGVSGAIFDSLTPAQQQLKRQEDLAKIFTQFNMSVPTSVQELIAIGESIDYTTSAGLDLAAAFPSLVSAFNETKNGVASLVDSLGDLSTDKFKSYVDYSRAQSYVQKGIPLSLLPSYDVGTSYVPQDGPAMIHQGERILTAAENRQFTASAGASNSAIVSLLNSLIAEIRAGNVPQINALQKIEKYLNKVDAQGVMLAEENNDGNRIVLDTRVVA